MLRRSNLGHHCRKPSASKFRYPTKICSSRWLVNFSYVCPSHPHQKKYGCVWTGVYPSKGNFNVYDEPWMLGHQSHPLSIKDLFSMAPPKKLWFYLLLFIVVSSRWLILYRGMGLFNTVICCSVQATPRQGFWWPRAARNATGRRRHLNIEHGESIMKNAWQKWWFQSRTTGI
jgi:hypothetical protein